MHDKINNAFSDVHAEESLKIQTIDKLSSKSKKRIPLSYKLIPIMAVIALFLISNLYFTPVSYISIDINPSIELKINRFDRVIDVVAKNEDAEEIVNAINLKNMNYINALETLKSNNSFESFADSYTEITVISNNNSNTDTIINNIQNCNFYGENVQCYHGNSELKKEACECNVSFGKYRAYLELLAVNQDVSLDEISALSMAEIRNMIDDYTEAGHQRGLRYNDSRHGQ
ncbi:MAG: hypothetical protein R3Y57_03650 [Erysipelotrichaceae bacterium]